MPWHFTKMKDRESSLDTYLPLEIAKTCSMTQYVLVGNALENLGTLVVDPTAAFQSNQFTFDA